MTTVQTLLERLKPEFKAILYDETYRDEYGYKVEALDALNKREFFTELKIFECMALCNVLHRKVFFDVSQIHELFKDNTI